MVSKLIRWTHENKRRPWFYLVAIKTILSCMILIFDTYFGFCYSLNAVIEFIFKKDSEQGDNVVSQWQVLERKWLTGRSCCSTVTVRALFGGSRYVSCRVILKACSRWFHSLQDLANTQIVSRYIQNTKPFTVHTNSAFISLNKSKLLWHTEVKITSY